MRHRRPPIHAALTFGLSTLALLACLALLVPPAFALFQNGSFEENNGSSTGWTKSTFLNYGLTLDGTSAFISYTGLTLTRNTAKLIPGGYSVTGANIARDTGGIDLTTVVGSPSTAPLSIADPIVGNVVMVPRFGNYAVRVNSDGSNTTSPGSGKNNNANTLTQQTTVSSNDVDSRDNKIHVRFAFAPVLENPGHSNSDQPYFYISIKNLTKGNALLYENFNFAGEVGVPWVSVNFTGIPPDQNYPSGTTIWMYTAWQLVDIAPGNGMLDVGDTIEFEIVAAGCALNGHGGYVYVDAFGAFFPSGLSVVNSASPIVTAGQPLAYDLVYYNNDVIDYADTVVTFTTPPNTTFTSVSGATCSTTPAAGSAVLVTCTIGTLAAGASGTFKVVVTVDPAAATDHITHITAGNYSISATGFSPVIGGAITTAITTNETNAYLIGMSTNPGTLLPAFNPNWLSYQVNVSNISSIDIIPTLAGVAPPPPLAPAFVTVNSVAPTSVGGPVTVSGLVIGDNVIPVMVTAPDGSTTKTYTVHVNVAPPVPVINSPTAGENTSSKRPPISGTGEAGATVTVTEGGSPICSTTVIADGTWACTPSADLPDGVHTISVTQTGTSNNTSSAGTRSFTVDSTPPTAPIISAPAEGENTSNPRPAISGTGEAGATVTVTENGNPICTALVASDGTWTCTPTSDLGKGVHNFSATQKDPALNESPPAGTRSFTVQPSLPSDLEVTQTMQMASLTHLTLGITVRNNGPNAVTGAVLSDTFPATLTGQVWSWTCTGTACSAASGTGNLSATLGTLAVDGTVTYTVTGTLANWSYWTNTASIAAPGGITESIITNNSSTVGRYQILLPIVYGKS